MNVIFYSSDGKKTVINTLTANYGKSTRRRTSTSCAARWWWQTCPSSSAWTPRKCFSTRSKQLIYTDSAMFVKVETPTEYIDGYGLTANQDLNPFRATASSGPAPAFWPKPGAGAASTSSPAVLFLAIRPFMKFDKDLLRTVLFAVGVVATSHRHLPDAAVQRPGAQLLDFHGGHDLLDAAAVLAAAGASGRQNCRAGGQAGPQQKQARTPAKSS